MFGLFFRPKNPGTKMIARFRRLSLFIQAFTRDSHGATAIEYALIATLIAVVIVGAVTGLGSAVAGLFGQAADGLE
jgi:pilus assembly protein Flp/PilA